LGEVSLIGESCRIAEKVYNTIESVATSIVTASDKEDVAADVDEVRDVN
jgi:hypothetical protein